MRTYFCSHVNHVKKFEDLVSFFQKKNSQSVASKQIRYIENGFQSDSTNKNFFAINTTSQVNTINNHSVKRTFVFVDVAYELF